MNRILTLFMAATTAVSVLACVRVKAPAAQATPLPPAASLWQEPDNLSSSDLFSGPWGAERAPQPDAIYTLVERKHAGVNPGMTVRDGEGREWSVKQTPPGALDHEAQVEVAFSRVLSAMGYHQAPVYFLSSFTLQDDWGRHREVGGRFRLKDKSLKEVGEWQWPSNPFLGTRPYQGLLVLMMMFNATDLKDSNNSIYEHQVGDRVELWYACRDVGSALGDWNKLGPYKSDPDAFDRKPFLIGVNRDYVQFAYTGYYEKYVRDRITPADVAWTSGRLGRLSERQWHDAFRAGGYDQETATRFIRRLQDKITEGRILRPGERL